MTTIKNIRSNYTGGHIGGCGPIEGETVTEITFEREDGTEYYVSGTTFQEYYNVYVSNESLYEKLIGVVECPVAETEERMVAIRSIASETYSGEINDYEDLEDSEYQKEFQMVLSHCFADWTNLKLSSFDESFVGKNLDEIEMDFPRDEDWDEDEEEEPEPLPGVESRETHCDVCKDDRVGESGPETVIMENKKEFLLRLSDEASIAAHPVEFDMDSYVEKEVRKELRALKKTMDEKEYQAWKNQYLNAEYEKVKDQKWVTVHYMFAGIGSYSQTVPESQQGCVIAFINSNGSAFLGRIEPATEEEVKNTLAIFADRNVRTESF